MISISIGIVVLPHRTFLSWLRSQIVETGIRPRNPFAPGSPNACSNLNPHGTLPMLLDTSQGHKTSFQQYTTFADALLIRKYCWPSVLLQKWVMKNSYRRQLHLRPHNPISDVERLHFPKLSCVAVLYLVFLPSLSLLL